ncbi:hypothetical protein GGR57DRAFT_38909 [Xylariaceae sp. FL1272]|nr:hypothetical protein GGR57DRAFT_38909 [Xylariaceae sp. FL1272]
MVGKVFVLVTVSWCRPAGMRCNFWNQPFCQPVQCCCIIPNLNLRNPGEPGSKYNRPTCFFAPCLLAYSSVSVFCNGLTRPGRLGISCKPANIPYVPPTRLIWGTELYLCQAVTNPAAYPGPCQSASFASEHWRAVYLSVSSWQ